MARLVLQDMAEIGLGLRQPAQGVVGGAAVEAGRMKVGPAGERPVEQRDRLGRPAGAGQQRREIVERLGEVRPGRDRLPVRGFGVRRGPEGFPAQAAAEGGVGVAGIERQRRLEGSLGRRDVARLEPRLGVREEAPWVVGFRRQNLSSPRRLTGSGKSR